MILTLISGIIVILCLVSTIVLYTLKRSNKSISSSHSLSSINEKQKIKYQFRPSIDIITKTLNQEFSFRSSIKSSRSTNSSSTINENEENEFDQNKTSHRSFESIDQSVTSINSKSVPINFHQFYRSKNLHWRQGSIINSNQMALIEFSLPPNHHDDKYRRRSVPVCADLIQPKMNLKIKSDLSSAPLLSFSLSFRESCPIQIQFQSLTGLNSSFNFQQITFKVKLLPDGKEKFIQIKKSSENENFLDNVDQQNLIQFSSIQLEKFREKSFLITINGKDQAKKMIQLGQIGKIQMNQFNCLQDQTSLQFLHQIEKFKLSSVELLIELERKNENYLHVELQRMKGLKIDQKNLDAKCYLRIALLDRHRVLTSQQTKTQRLNSSTMSISEQFDFNILCFDSSNFDRFMLIISLYSNANLSKEFQCIAHIKLASPLLCSGSGTIHWQQFKARNSFSMWHTLNKYQSV